MRTGLSSTILACLGRAGYVLPLNTIQDMVVRELGLPDRTHGCREFEKSVRSALGRLTRSGRVERSLLWSGKRTCAGWKLKD